MTDTQKILSYVPTVIESSSRGEKSFDIFSLKNDEKDEKEKMTMFNKLN